MAGLPNLMTNKDEGKTEIVGDNCVSMNCRTRPYYHRSCKRIMKGLSHLESLPNDLMFEILVHLPARDIYEPARLVCRKWYHMIHTRNFIYAHLQRLTCGLLFQYLVVEHAVFIVMRQSRVEISEFSYKFRCPVWASCNGLILEYGVENFCTLYVANPVTKQHFILPLFFREIGCYDLSGIAYVEASMEYKVVLTYRSNALECAILTVGVDNSWRIVRDTAKQVFATRPLIAEGFMHWGGVGSQVLTLNLEIETITETPVPIPQVYGVKEQMYYFSAGRYLSLLIARGNFSWEVWEMKPETGEWTKLPNIVLEAQKCTSEQFGCEYDMNLIPVGWLEYLEVLLFASNRQAQACISYNLRTREIDSIKLPTYVLNYSFVAHRNSLVWLGGC